MTSFNTIARTLTMFLATGVLLVSSCKKEETPAQDPEVVAEATVNEIELSATFEDVFDNAAGIDGTTAGDDLGIYGGTGFGIFPGQATQTTVTCYTVTVTPKDKGVFPKKVVLDFGTGCEINGHVRKGKIITVYSGPLHIPGNKAVTEFDGYQIDDFKVTGRHVILNSTEPGANQRKFTRTVENAKVTNVSTGFWRSWSAVITMKQIEGNGTPLWPVDDVYQFTGRREGANSKGRTWVSETKEPLIKAFTCPWISKGILVISVNGTVGSIDFGNGACDDEATVTINGVSKTIKLR
ncbi:MAG TPA: hypothetical protein VK166_18010 [Chitinophagaceae bacterium]|nr:hypothetical protein [Chitinophagaceae bacterium]